MTLLLPARRPLQAPPFTRNDLWRRARAVPSLDLRFADSKSLVDAVSGQNLVTFTRSSNGTYVGSDGLIKTATTNEPRFDHNPTTGESLGLLVEEQRTNLLLQSEEFGTTWSQANTTVSANTSTSPAGDSTADIITPAASTSAHLVAQAVTVQASTQYIASVYVKSDGAPFVQVVYDNGNSIGAFLNINTSTGAITRGPEPVGGASNVVGGVVPVSNGWYRLFIGATHTETISRILVSPLPAGGGTSSINPTTTTTTNDRIAIWGAQLEAGAFPTSYIPTTTSAATRAADVATITGSNFSSWYRQDEHTAFIDFSNEATAGSDRRVLSFAEAGGFAVNGEVLFVSNAAQRAASFNSFVASANIGRLDSSISLVTRTRRRAAFSFAASSRVLSVDGETPIVSTTAFAPPSNIVSAAFGSDGLGSGQINGHIRRLAFWSQRLSNNVLQAITQ